MKNIDELRAEIISVLYDCEPCVARAYETALLAKVKRLRGLLQELETQHQDEARDPKVFGLRRRAELVGCSFYKVGSTEHYVFYNRKGHDAFCFSLREVNDLLANEEACARLREVTAKMQKHSAS